MTMINADEITILDESGDPLGHVHRVSGSSAAVGLLATALTGPGRFVTVGKFLKIRAGESLLVGVITDVSIIQNGAVGGKQGYSATAQVDLMGEIDRCDSAEPTFRRGEWAGCCAANRLSWLWGIRRGGECVRPISPA